MKNISKYTVTISLLLAFLFIAGLEFYTWRTHNYAPDYKLRQKCIEVSPSTEKEQIECAQLKK